MSQRRARRTSVADRHQQIQEIVGLVAANEDRARWPGDFDRDLIGGRSLDTSAEIFRIKRNLEFFAYMTSIDDFVGFTNVEAFRNEFHGIVLDVETNLGVFLREQTNALERFKKGFALNRESVRM